MHGTPAVTTSSALPLDRGAEKVDQSSDAGGHDRTLLLWLTNSAHAVNHFQNAMLTVLYPTMMADLGFGYAQLGALSAIQGMFGNATQAFYGFLAQFARRTHLLGFSNMILGLGVFLTGLVPSYPFLILTRAVAQSGGSAQHPVGASLLSANFPTKRGTVLALHSSVAQVGGLLAPVVVGALLFVVGWRQIFFIAAAGSFVMGAVMLFFRDRDPRANSTASRSARLAQGRASYLRVFRNRNMMVISLVMMVGAAGRNEGADLNYLSGHLQNDFGYTAAMTGLVIASLTLGSIGGPIGFGWLADRFSPRGVLQVSLVLSALTTWWLAGQGAELVLLMFNLFLHGAVSYSRNSLTQALVASSADDIDRDAAFSSYYFIGFASAPLWALLGGWLMDTAGFHQTFLVYGCSYLVGMLLLCLIRTDGRDGAQIVRARRRHG
jgi:MFS transporter, FSR family, fosmidomycin resistance protein